MILKLSPAKVNLHLSVLRKRPDGYHDIATLMQAISLYDELEFSSLPSGIVINCPGSDLPEDEGNIVYRAAKTFLSRLSSPTGIGITISKKIPLAAGLGGGSSNAATTLMTLNEMTGGRCSKAELMEMGRELGADVPFFIFGQAAWAEGIGDRLQEASGLPRFWFLLLNPGFPVSTKMVYENLNLGLTKEEINYSMRRFEIEPGSNRIEGLHNDLEEVTLTLHPSLRRLKEFLLSCGASGALMSGSGPTIFGVFATEGQARAAKEAVVANGWEGPDMYIAQAL